MEIRVTKYNPIYRNEKGHYPLDEWTEYFQVGQIFDGKEFTYNEYVETENKYITAIQLFLDEYNCQIVIIEELEIDRGEKRIFNEKEKVFLETFKQIKKHSIINRKEISDAASLILRGLFWGVWYNIDDPKVSIRFGYDFYMYFVAPEISQSLIEKIESTGLFVDYGRQTEFVYE